MLDRALLACGGKGVDLSKLFVEVLDGDGQVYGSATVDHGSLTSVTLDSGFGSFPPHTLHTARVTLSDGKVYSAVSGTQGNSQYTAEIRFTAAGESVGLLFSNSNTYMGSQIPGMEYSWNTSVSKL